MSTESVPHPYRVHTSEQSRQIDAETIQSFGIDGHTLMEIAGSTIARHLLDRTAPGSHGLLLCGRGNNGGDALSIARWLIHRNRKVTVVFVGGSDALSGDAERNLGLLRKIAGQDSALPLKLVEQWDDFIAATSPASGPAEETPSPIDFIVDGMLGTGITDTLRPPYLEAVGYVNRSPLPVYAIDIPSGLHADRGVPLGGAVRAGETFACGTRKTGYYLEEGPLYCGQITWCDLPFPDYLRRESLTTLIDRSWLPDPLPVPARHKYNAGVLYLIAGSEGLTGAARMAAGSAWSTGIGAVIWLCPRGLLSRVEGTDPQIIKRPVGKPEDLRFRESHLPEVQSILAEKEGRVVIGPGLGRNPDTDRFTKALLASAPLPFLIDADAIRALAQQPVQRPEKADWILTPHAGELRDLLGEDAGEGWDRLRRVARFSREQRVTLLSKGMPVIVGSAEGDTCLTGYDTRIFSRAGFGDLLSGRIGGYWALGHTALHSCALALVGGYERIRQLADEHPNRIPEPLDLI